jgi:hypothetical protein
MACLQHLGYMTLIITTLTSFSVTLCSESHFFVVDLNVIMLGVVMLIAVAPKKLARDEHPSLFYHSVCDEENSSIALTPALYWCEWPL